MELRLSKTKTNPVFKQRPASCFPPASNVQLEMHMLVIFIKLYKGIYTYYTPYLLVVGTCRVTSLLGKETELVYETQRTEWVLEPVFWVRVGPYSNLGLPMMRRLQFSDIATGICECCSPVVLPAVTSISHRSGSQLSVK